MPARALPEGLVTLIFVEDSTVTPVAELLPNLTVEPVMNPVPVIVTDVPPASGPLFGVIPVIAGATASATPEVPKIPARQSAKTSTTRRIQDRMSNLR